MTLVPDRHLGRALAVSLVLLLVGLAWQLVLDPVAAAFTDRWDARAELEASLAEYRRRSAPLRELSDQREALLRRQTGQAGLLSDANAALAGAGLQATMRRLLDANNSALRSLQALPVRLDGGLQRIAVRLDATVPAGRLLDLLYAIEAADPYLFVDGIDLRVPDTLPRDGAGHAQLALRAEIAAYRRPETR